MDFSSQQSNGFGNGFESTRKPSGNTRRIWTTREEKVLLAALKDLVAKGQKIDNGFRTGYLNKLEDALRKAFPGCDLQATPHITSKIITWRKHYSAIVSAKLLATGVGFNTTTCQLDCTDDQWDAIVKTRHCEEWPYFVDWIDIFGKDRATGEAAREVPEAVGEIEGQAQPPNLNIPEESNDDNVFNGEGQSGVHKNTNQTHGDQEENSASQKAKNTSRRRKHIYEQLGKIEGLSIKDKLHASKIIGGKVETLEMWTTLPDDARVVFVIEILGRD
ncbi:hypothetical protein ACS0TY_020663 [Phlomoides rotata]